MYAHSFSVFTFPRNHRTTARTSANDKPVSFGRHVRTHTLFWQAGFESSLRPFFRSILMSRKAFSFNYGDSWMFCGGRIAVFLKMTASHNFTILIPRIRDCQAVMNHSFWRNVYTYSFVCTFPTNYFGCYKSFELRNKQNFEWVLFVFLSFLKLKTL
jgi:hypothetical protein